MKRDYQPIGIMSQEEKEQKNKPKLEERKNNEECKNLKRKDQNNSKFRGKSKKESDYILSNNEQKTKEYFKNKKEKKESKKKDKENKKKDKDKKKR